MINDSCQGMSYTGWFDDYGEKSFTVKNIDVLFCSLSAIAFGYIDINVTDNICFIVCQTTFL